MGALLGFFAAGGLQLKALIIGAMAMLVACLALTTWALLERSGRLSLKVEVATLRAQTQVLADSLGRCNVSIENAAKAGNAAVEETRRLVGMATRAMERNAVLRDDIRGIVSKPAPVRADGKAKDCADAIREIKAKVQP